MGSGDIPSQVLAMGRALAKSFTSNALDKLGRLQRPGPMGWRSGFQERRCI